MKKQTKNKEALKTLKRLLLYVTKGYKVQFIVVCISIVISALVGVLGIQFLKYLIDDFITPLIGNNTSNYSSLTNAVLMTL